MLGFSHPWRRSGRVEFVAPPAEEPRALTVADIDRRLEVVSLMPASIRAPETWDVVDRLLDRRNAIRPPRPAPVPVIPGRSS